MDLTIVIVAATAIQLSALILFAIVVRRPPDLLHTLRLLAEQNLANTRAEAETTRASLEAGRREDAARWSGLQGTIDASMAETRALLLREQGELRTLIATGQGQAQDQAQALRAAIETGMAETRTVLTREQGELRTTITATQAQASERATELRSAVEAALEQMRTVLTREQGELRVSLTEAQRSSDEQATLRFDALRSALTQQVTEMRESNEARLGEIQKTVNEQLHAAVEKQMTDSFARVIDQFAAVQKAMGDVQAVTAQIGDIKRLFGNVRTRGGWGETQVRVMLDDILPPGAYETNRKLREGSDEQVEFAVVMPVRGEVRPLLPIDAKFPVEDYERLLAAAEQGDVEAERSAARALERRVREEARKIAEKYIVPPATVEFAVMYLPTDALYAEVARIPGLIDSIGRECRVLLMGPSLLPALLRTIHLGFVTLALEQKADEVRDLLGATRTELTKMDKVLDTLAKHVGRVSKSIEDARTRTRVMGRKLRAVDAIDETRAITLLELDATADDASLEAEDVAGGG